MILDSRTMFSDAQAVTASAIGANVYDTNPNAGPNTQQDLGNGEPLYLVVHNKVAAAAAGAATVTVTLESANDTALSVGGKIHYASKAFALADMAGDERMLAIRLPSDMYNRYVGVRYAVANGPLTAGSFDAFLVKDIDSNIPYARGFSVT